MINSKGYEVVSKVFTEEEISFLREKSFALLNSGRCFENSGGLARPDFIKDELAVDIVDLLDSKDLASLISKMVGEDVEFISHNDLHLNRTVGWHKDRLNGEVNRFEEHSPWETVDGQSMKIFKCNIYLQDHTNYNDCLTVRDGSHLTEDMNVGEIKVLRPGIGDIVVFDQRLTHRGPQSKQQDRLLICMGYGVKNIFFEEFEKGTIFRQDKQNDNIYRH
jgi:hypothetical protein